MYIADGMVWPRIGDRRGVGRDRERAPPAAWGGRGEVPAPRHARPRDVPAEDHVVERVGDGLVEVRRALRGEVS